MQKSAVFLVAYAVFLGYTISVDIYAIGPLGPTLLFESHLNRGALFFIEGREIMFTRYNHLIRYIQLLKDDATAANDVEAQQLLYVIACSLELFDIHRSIYDTELHEISVYLEEDLERWISNILEPQVRALLQHSLHLCKPSRFPDVPASDYIDYRDVARFAEQIKDGSVKADYRTVAAYYDAFVETKKGEYSL